MDVVARRARVGLLSDTHIPEAGPDLPAEAYAALERCDRILHGGDLHCIEVVDRLERLAPTIASRGNGDDYRPQLGRPGVPEDPRLAESFVVAVGPFRIGLTHDLEHLEARPEDVVQAGLIERFGERVDIAVCGHSHVPMVWGLEDGTAIVNPGSPTLPYGYRDVLGTVGFIDVADNSFEITVLDLVSAAVQLRLIGPSPAACTRGPRPVGGR